MTLVGASPHRQRDFVTHWRGKSRLLGEFPPTNRCTGRSHRGSLGNLTSIASAAWRAWAANPFLRNYSMTIFDSPTGSSIGPRRP